MKTTLEERAQQVREEYAFVELVMVPARVVRCFHARRRESDYLIMATPGGYACTCTAWARSEDRTCKHGQAVPTAKVAAQERMPVSVPSPRPSLSLQDGAGATMRVTYDERGRVNDRGW